MQQKNETVTSTTTPQIQQILTSRYSEENQQLNLQKHIINWSRAILAKDFSKLKGICLGHNQISDAKIKMLAGLDWPFLENLNLGTTKPNSQFNQITSVGLNSLLLNNNMPKLQKINLYKNNIGDEGMRILSKTQSLPQLTKLYIEENNISGLGFLMFSGCRFGKLKELALNDNAIGNTGVKLIIKAHLPDLTTLWMNSCQIGNEACQHLNKSNWPKLIQLGYYNNPIKYDGHAWIRENNWKDLIQFWNNLEETQDAIGLLWLVCTQWSGNKSIQFAVENYKLSSRIKDILDDRFCYIEQE